jgi:hypothetical protein
MTSDASLKWELTLGRKQQMLQKIEVSLQQLVGRENVSLKHLDWANEQVSLFFGSFRKADADDPQTFSAGCLRLFTAYDSAVVQYVVDPVTGLPGRSVWLPSLSEVKAALDQRAAELLRGIQRARDEAKNLEERRKWLEARKNKPTLEEMQAKYGKNWGLPTLKEETERDKAARLSKITEANARLLKREYEAAGLTPRMASSSIPISLELSRKLAAE